MFVWRNIRSLQYLTSAYKRTFSTNSLALRPVFSWLYWAIMLWQKKKESAKQQTRICFIFVEATALFCDDSCSWVQAQQVQAVTTWIGTLVQDPDRQSTEAGRLCVNWGEPLNLWSKAYLKEREELVGKKKSGNNSSSALSANACKAKGESGGTIQQGQWVGVTSGGRPPARLCFLQSHSG